TPVERAYSDIFGTYYFDILERVPELRDLVECARAIGIFKWLRENNVPFTAGALATNVPRGILTPRQVSLRSSAKLEDLVLKRPLVMYAEFGPTEVFDISGGVSRIKYERGRLKEIVRADGRTLNVHTDDLG